jgi:Domain of unknown function (DU1801)
MRGLQRILPLPMLPDMQSDATSVADYLAALPDKRREDIGIVRAVVNAHLPPGYVEAMAYGMITYQVPLSVQPETYNGMPLIYAGLASQKNHMSLYMCSLHSLPGAAEAFVKSWKATGRKLDMGKSCLRFRHAEDLDLDMIGRVIAATPVVEFVKLTER